MSKPVFRERDLFLGEAYPVAERLSRRGLYLPSSPTLDDRQRSSGVCGGGVGLEGPRDGDSRLQNG